MLWRKAAPCRGLDGFGQGRRRGACRRVHTDTPAQFLGLEGGLPGAPRVQEGAGKPGWAGRGPVSETPAPASTLQATLCQW